MAFMIVVSNRLPFVLKRDEKTGALSRHATAGGLVTAMAPIVKKTASLWVGWPGSGWTVADCIPHANPESDLAADQIEPHQFRPVDISAELFSDFYNGCCNAIFWPLLHSMPDRCIFDRDYWRAYSAVNTIFAQQTFEGLLSSTKADPKAKAPLIWIHDYQLMLVPTLVRELAENAGIACRLAFFLHIPYPSYDIFQLFPWDDEVLVGLLGCDLIGFHIEGYAQNFVTCCEKRLGCRVDRERMLIEHDGRTVRVAPFPIGVPFNRFEDMAKKELDCEECDPRFSMVLGVDRLDYTKGILLRIKAFEKLLEMYPEHSQKVILFQVVVPSRIDVPEYQVQKNEIEREVGRINGRFSSINWSPIRYVYRQFTQQQLCAFYKKASVALVTPIRDGMNLVAKEFVACQIDEPGVLILSRFTGAGQTMHEALIVNPFEVFELADTIHRALTMPEDERRLRMSALKRRERKNDVNHWLQSFLDATGINSEIEVQDRRMKPLTMEDFDSWIDRYLDDDCKLALLLDYDGTLAPISEHPDQAHLPAQTRQILETLVDLADVYVAVISGRNVENVRNMVSIDKITYAGNHGLDIVHPDGTKFIHPDQARFSTLIGSLATDLERDVCKDGAWIEDKGIILTWHYRLVPKELRQSLIDTATALILKHDFRPCKSHCAIEARPPIKWDKGRACIYAIRTTFGMDWSERVRIIYVGDDATDEDAMKALSGMALTFRVSQISKGRTAANRRLHGTQSVLTMLQWVQNHMDRRKERRNSRRCSD